MNILCAVAHQLELDPFKAKYSGVEQFNTGFGNLYQLARDGKDLNLIRTGIGLDSADKTLEQALRFLATDGITPDLILNFGTCGAIHPERRVGDLIVGTGVVMDEMPELRLDEKWRTRFQEYLKFQDKQAIPGIIYSTEKAVADDRTRHRISHETHAQIVEMECYSLAQIAKENNIPLLSVKYISDNADEFLMKDFLANVNEAMTELSDIIVGFIESLKSAPDSH